MTKDEIRTNLTGPCGHSYGLCDELTDMFGDLYARVLAAEARIAALESPAPSDPVSDASAAMEDAPPSVRQAYITGFADGAAVERERK